LIGIGRVLVGKDDLDVRRVLQAVEHLQPAAAAIATQAIRRVSDVLKFVEHEARHHQLALQETGIADIAYAPVHDNAGIQDTRYRGPGAPFHHLWRPRRSEKIEEVLLLLHRHDIAYHAAERVQDERENPAGVRSEEDHRGQERYQEPGDDANCSHQEVGSGNVLDGDLETIEELRGIPSCGPADHEAEPHADYDGYDEADDRIRGVHLLQVGPLHQFPELVAPDASDEHEDQPDDQDYHRYSLPFRARQPSFRLSRPPFTGATPRPPRMMTMMSAAPPAPYHLLLIITLRSD
jgi:hypothetical protein